MYSPACEVIAGMNVSVLVGNDVETDLVSPEMELRRMVWSGAIHWISAGPGELVPNSARMTEHIIVKLFLFRTGVGVVVILTLTSLLAVAIKIGSGNLCIHANNMCIHTNNLFKLFTWGAFVIQISRTHWVF